MKLSFYGATREVTGSCYLLQTDKHKVLIECGLIQGSRSHERHNEDAFPFDVNEIDAVVLTHAHLDHSGRLPLLIKRGYTGPIYTHSATADLCSIMLEDSGYLNEKEAEWENKGRSHDEPKVEPLYTRMDARATLEFFQCLSYEQVQEILPGIVIELRDAGHILGSASVQFKVTENNKTRHIVFSGDIGHKGAPILKNPKPFDHADLVVMESTYGDRVHRSWEATWQELGEAIASAQSEKGNILIPAFTIGRTQELLYAFKLNYDAWNLGDWKIFLDSPMGIEATQVYSKHAELYDTNAQMAQMDTGGLFDLPNLFMSKDTEYSMSINQIQNGAIIIAGSGMCTGGRIKHHLKHNIWRAQTRVIIVGYQAYGTPGRALVDGAKQITLWGNSVPVNARVYTIGGLSAHADQQGLVDWYRHYEHCPDIVLVHGEQEAMQTLSQRLQEDCRAGVTMASYKQTIEL